MSTDTRQLLQPPHFSRGLHNQTGAALDRSTLVDIMCEYLGSCLQDKREDYHNHSVLYCVLVVYNLHTHEQFLQITAGLGLDLAFCMFFMFPRS